MRIWLKDQRITMRLTQNDVANQSNISRSYYTQIELNNKTPIPKTAKKIANALNIDWTDFY